MIDKAINDLLALKSFRVDIEAALCYDHDSHTFDDVCAKVLSGRVDLYVLDGAIVIAELIHLPQYAIYNVFIAAGSLQPILEFQRTTLIREAEARGAKRVSLVGRRGWTKVLETEGWSSDLVVMSKEVKHGKDTHTGAKDGNRQGSGGRDGEPLEDVA